ncbi:EAL domain-containing protein [Acidiferrimicrobium sp. IK]|uniref:sensor domain-containing phosphodiesterase n=1 Tax=Acidiferrimicrobium sp. IK TaxID=2871700 RepID=UPI0021CB8777|nr:EAL domain-containing protein [Acidiferrimicrobium sp. IK]MCU4185472.1 EAL domain-containing protein [Acidiferrimicrobium sp. IK]
MTILPACGSTAEFLAESIPHIVWTAAPDGTTTYLNRQGCEYTGCSPEAASDRARFDLIHPDDVERSKRAWITARATGVAFEVEHRMRRHDGAFRWHLCRGVPMRDQFGRIEMWVGTSTDIEEQKRLEASLRRSERDATASLSLLRSVGDAATAGFKLVDTNLRIVRINQMLADICGAPAHELLGRKASEVVAPDVWAQIEGAYRRALAGEAVSNLDVTGHSSDGSGATIHWLASYYPVRIGREIIGVGNVVVDITERRKEEGFRAAVTDSMAEGLCALDADGRVTYLNPAATEMLGWTEGELRGRHLHELIHFRRADGSIVPAPDCSLGCGLADGQRVSRDYEMLVRKDGSAFPVAYSSVPLRNGSSIEGMVVLFRDITEEKREQEALQRELAAVSWVGRIRDAIDEDRLVLHSQPIVPLKGGRPAEELLLRMRGRDGELITPGSFLPVAERFGLIAEIDRWVIAGATRLAAASPDRVIEINLSAASICTTGLFPYIEKQIRTAGADPSRLVFEITETALMSDMALGEALTRALAGIGCGIALDDFGTGFGSFTYLKRLPITYLKIDIEFVRDLATNLANRHVVAAIVSLAQAFGLQTIAEGIENDETLRLITAAGVDFAQGFHLGRPAPA